MKTIKLEIKDTFWGPRPEIEVFVGIFFKVSAIEKKISKGGEGVILVPPNLFLPRARISLYGPATTTGIRLRLDLKNINGCHFY